MSNVEVQYSQFPYESRHMASALYLMFLRGMQRYYPNTRAVFESMDMFIGLRMSLKVPRVRSPLTHYLQAIQRSLSISTEI
uniref:Hypotheticial protein n=1 Tax=Schistosoma japonicum TaxID=6182 RepID=C7TST0_SCHJA|nr:hypotheticial protein [Schistosoma japonicum]